MLSRGTLAVVVLGLGLVLSACQQPTVDPDQAYRDLIIGPHWYSDPAYQTSTPADPIEFHVLFRANGTAVFDSGSRVATWTYNNKIFTLKYTDNNQTDGTVVEEKCKAPDFAVTSSRLQFVYGGSVCHLYIP